MMGMYDAWKEGGLLVPWARLTKSNRKQLFAARKEGADYYLIGGEVKSHKQDFDRLIILEVAEHGRILIDMPASKADKCSEYFREYHIDLDKLGQSLGFATKRDDLMTYDPATQYVVSRKKQGRPVNDLTDKEKQKIDELRAKGVGYNAIAKKIKRGAKKVIAYCNSLS